MPIEFREVRRGEIDDALAFAASRGGEVQRAQLDARLSLIARNREQKTLGSALHHRDDTGRRHIVVHLEENTHPGLARLLLDRALGKAGAAKIATTDLQISAAEAEAITLASADWLSRLQAKPTSTHQPTATPQTDPSAPSDPTAESTDSSVTTDQTDPSAPTTPPETTATTNPDTPEEPTASPDTD